MGSRSAKIGGFILLLLVGWAFVLGSNKFHVTAASVIVCLSYLAILFTVWNLWRTGASAAGPVEEDEGWSRPIGARGELEKEKKTLLKGIKEAEFDAAMGKLSKADADSLIRDYRGRAIEVIKQIEHEVKARIALDLSDKPSNRAKKVVNARAAKADAMAAMKSNGVKANEKDVAPTENAEAKSEERPALPAEISAEAKAKASAEADAIAAKAQATAAAQKVALAEAKAAAAQAAAEAAEAKAEAARAMAEAAEAKAEAVKAAAETKVGAKAEGERA